MSETAKNSARVLAEGAGTGHNEAKVLISWLRPSRGATSQFLDKNNEKSEFVSS